jgi:hypothetical protein
MMDDREISLIAAFRLHEVASRLSVLARVARSPELREALTDAANLLADYDRRMSDLAAALPVEGRLSGSPRTQP